MKRKPITKKQRVQRRRKKGQSALLRLFSFMAGCFTKMSLLILSLALISALFVAVYEALLRSSLFRLEKVVIQGVEDEDRKRELLAKSGLSRDLSLLVVDASEVRRRFREDPWVREVALQKRFPHTLIVEVEEQEACALVLLDRLYYVNRWGEVFKAVEEGEEVDFPVITGVDTPGGAKDNFIRQAVRAIERLEVEGGRWSIDQLAEVHLNGDGKLLFYYASLPAPVAVGYGSTGFSMTALKKVVEDLDRRGTLSLVRRIDVNDPIGIVVSFRDGLFHEVTEQNG